ncbi:putative LRR receptor-like serine/threonine-protein kinase-like [Capsicum annuum]|nr:putative LRR receptor-like serine/threonine-protein kinase-like [Capsicum annuum]
MGLFYSKDCSLNLIGYADVGCLSDPHKARSQIGYVFICGGTTISWRYTKQYIVATSSNYAEIITIHETSRECGVMKKSFKDSLKALEADIQHANTLASDYPREYDGASFQMRLSYSPCAQFFLFLVQWTDCHFAGALGLLRILIYKAYEDGKTGMYIHERKASIKQFYGVIFPSLLQLQRGITDIDDRKQREICATKYRRRDETNKGKVDFLAVTSLNVIGEENYSYWSLRGLSAYRVLSWRARSQSCPFCRDSLKRVNSGELWIYTNLCDIKDLSAIMRENMKRLLMYIEKLPVIYPDPALVSYHAPHY